ncbi:MAG: hypothetical protein ACRD9W_14380, partial [Terriglobia bacterium]
LLGTFSGMIRFARWMEESGLRDEPVAVAVGVVPSTICRIRNQERRASAKLIESLVRYSAEQVAAGTASRALEPNDFFEAESEPAE